MRCHNNYGLFVFCFALFFILSITSAGIYLNDEWMTAQTLNQISLGHQISTNEGKYGYYTNGSAGNYMIYRSNILMYSAALPLISLPAVMIIPFARRFLVCVWILCAAVVLNRVVERDLHHVAGIAALVSIFVVDEFPYGGKFVPSEVLAIVMTNIFLFGIFAYVMFKISCEMFEKIEDRMFLTLCSIACSSIIFWTGTCKDHLLSALLVGLIVLFMIRYIKYEKNLEIASALTGLLMFVRVEVAIGVFVVILIMILTRRLSNTITYMVYTGVGSIPFWVNNWIVTGNPFLPPFLLANKYVIPTIEYQISSMPAVTMGFAEQAYVVMDTIFRTIASPQSGSVGLLLILGVFFLALPFGLKITRTTEENVMFYVGIGACIYMLVFNCMWLQSDTGVSPDIRYFVPSYAMFSMFGISTLIRRFELNSSRMILNTMIIIAMISIISLTCITSIDYFGSNISSFNRLMNTMAMISFGVSIIFVINSMRSRKTRSLLYVIPLLVALPFVWQFVVTFIYSDIKVNGYPMLIPVAEYIHKALFIW